MTTSLRSLLLTSCALLLLFTTGSNEALAQSKRADKSLFLNARVGFSTYGGDRDEEPGEDFTSLAISDHLSDASYSLGAEIGYAFTPAWSLSLGLQFGNYPEINNNFDFDDGLVPVLDEDESSTTRLTIPVMLRFMVLPSKRLSPYVHGGVNLSFASFTPVGESSQSETAFGPVLGFGLDYVLSRQTSLFLEMTGFYGFGDDKLDAADPGVDGDETNFDLLGFYGLGLRYSFKPACEPARILSMDGPDRVELGQSATFTATINDDACDPTDVVWDLGDGTTATGLTVTHTYTAPGDYTVSVTASNSEGSDSRSKMVNVFDPCPDPAEIVTITADPTDLVIGETVTFSAQVNGTEPYAYQWNFGDGGSASSASATHSYDDPGDYTISLEVTNCKGSDRRDLNLMVRAFRCSDITELNSVFFEKNSAELTDEAKALLDENIEKLVECAEMLVRLDGYADRGERRPRRLSEARAKAVEQYYIDNGIAPSRLFARGLGRDPLAGKGVDGRRNRRVDSIIVDSFEMDEDN